MVHTVKGFGIVNKADVFLELWCFFNDPADVGNLISGSSAFSKSSLNIWRFMVHVLLKPDLENFEHYFTSMWDECNCAVVWAFFGIAFLRDWNKHWPFPVLWPLVSFPYLLAYWVAALSQHHLLGFEIAQLEFHHLHQLCSQWCFLRPTWLCIPGCLVLGEWSHHHSYLGHEDLFCIVLLCILATSS